MLLEKNAVDRSDSVYGYLKKSKESIKTDRPEPRKKQRTIHYFHMVQSRVRITTPVAHRHYLCYPYPAFQHRHLAVRPVRLVSVRRATMLLPRQRQPFQP